MGGALLYERLYVHNPFSFLYVTGLIEKIKNQCEDIIFICTLQHMYVYIMHASILLCCATLYVCKVSFMHIN